MNGHTTADTHALGDHAEDRQPRERSVPCLACTTSTWHLSGYCDRHYQPPRQPSVAYGLGAMAVATVAHRTGGTLAVLLAIPAVWLYARCVTTAVGR